MPSFYLFISSKVVDKDSILNFCGFMDWFLDLRLDANSCFLCGEEDGRPETIGVGMEERPHDLFFFYNNVICIF